MKEIYLSEQVLTSNLYQLFVTGQQSVPAFYAVSHATITDEMLMSNLWKRYVMDV